MGIKLYRRGGNSTPSPTWKIESSDNIYVNKNIFFNKNTTSARKLGACLWESAAEKMTYGGSKFQRNSKNKGIKVPAQIDADFGRACDEPPRPSESSFKREITASLIKHHRSVKRNSHALLTVSPAGYNSPVEVTPFNPPLKPRPFQGLEGKIENSLLNRIWSLEEQHALNISFISSMKMELDQARFKIKMLLREKNKEQENVKAKMKSMRDEIEREIVNRERNRWNLLEDLCDEFASGIRDYEREMRHFKHNPNRNRETPDRLIVHLSEAWLDERAHTQQDDAKGTIVDKLSLEIRTFLQEKAAKRTLNEDKLSLKNLTGRSVQEHLLTDSKLRQNRQIYKQSLQSCTKGRSKLFLVKNGDRKIILTRQFKENGFLGSAMDEDDSTTSDSNCIQSHQKEKPKSKTKKKVHSHNKQEKNDPRVNSNCVVDNGFYKINPKSANVLTNSTLRAKLLEARLEG